MTILSTMSRFGATLALLGACTLPVSAATVTLVAGNGFSDATPRSPEGGNNGTTLGQQRTNLFNAAAQVWGAALTSTQTIKVQAAFETLTCTAGSGTLGSAGATGNYILTDGVDDRYYAVALAEALTGQNLNATASNTNEISATFNARVDLDDTGCLGSTRFYYGLTGPAPAGTIALYPVVLHELAHGLGFAAFICRTSPQCTNTTPATPYGAYFFDVPDVWSDTIRDNNIDGLGSNRRWSELSTAERVVSFTHDPFLVWNGMTVSSNIAGQAAVAKNEDRLRMYAPGTFVPGSSISHFHSDASPNLLMEPSLSTGVFTQTDLTDCLLADIGWINSRCATVINTTPTLDALPGPVNLLEDAATQVVNLSGIGDADVLVQELSVAAVSSNTALIANPTVSYTNPASTGSISYTPQPNQSGSAVITVGVFDDGGWANGGNDLVTRQFTVNVTAVNDAPVISGSAPTTATEAVAYNYAPGATDVDGPGQTWSLISPTHTCGGAINASSGAFTFTPAGPTPPASCVVALQVCDGGSPNLCASQSASVSIAAVNSAPTISSTAATTATEDLAYSYSATRNDPDGPGQSWSLVSPTHTCGGSINPASGLFAFTPAGPVPPSSCVVAVQVCDGGSPNLCATQNTKVSIAAVNDAPTITSSAPTTATEDVAYSYNATRDDADGPSQNWTLVSPTHTCGGSINASSGAFAFTPAGPLPPASCVVAVQVCDGATPNLCATQTTTVTIAAINDAPTITGSVPATATEDVAYSYSPTRNDPDGPGQSWSLISPTHTCGGNINSSTGAFAFTPAGPTPPASCVVALQLCDGATPNLCVTQTATVTIAAVNDAPTITSSAPTAATEDVAYSYNATRDDADGPSQNWTLVSPTHTCGGSINASSGAFAFTPAGPLPPASCVVAVQVCDGATPNLCATQTTTVTIAAINDAPTITGSVPATATEDVAYSYSPTRNDPDGPGQSWSLISPTHTCGGNINSSTGAFAFTPAGPTPPASCVVALQLCDGATPNLCVTQTATVTIAAVNDAPTITSSAPTAATEDVAYNYNATRDDADGPGQNWSLVSPTHTCGGSINASSGAFAFTPAGPVPPASCVVAVQVCDGATPSLCATQTTTVIIAAVNNAPVISSVAPALAVEDSVYSYSASRNDPDGPGQNWNLSAAHTCGGSIVPASGVFTFTPAGPTPAPGCVVSIEVCDGGTPNLCSGPQTTSITITAINDPPIATAPASVGTSEDTVRPFSGSDRLGLGDPDSASVQVTLSVDHGSLSLGTLAGLTFVDGDGSNDASMRFNATPANADAALATLSFRPTADYNGSATLNYSVDDGTAAAVQRSVAIAIAAQADIVDDSVSVPEDGSLAFNVITGTQGASPDSFAGTPVLSAIGSAAHGTATFAADGTVSYTPAANFSGSDTFSYSVSSGGVSESGSITVTIAAVNDAPTLNAIPDPALIGVDAGQQTINLGGIGAGGGETGQTLAVTAVSSNPALIPNPSVSYTSPNASGTLTFAPQPAQHGVAVITVTVTDSGGTANGGTNTVSRSFSQVVGELDRIFANGFQSP